MHFLFFWRNRQLIRNKTTKREFFELGAILLLCIGIFVPTMVIYENMTIGDALWLASTSITTIGYGDLSASTPIGRIISVMVLFIPALAIFARMIDIYQDMREFRSNAIKTGKWNWKLNDHILVIGSPNGPNAVKYFQEFIREIRDIPEYNKIAINILTDQWTTNLCDFDNRTIFNHGNINSPGMSEQVGLTKCRAIFVIAPSGSNDDDSITFSTVYHVREQNPSVPIIAECVSDHNRKRIIAAGATSVIRPMRSYPAMAVRAMVAPGTEEIIEDLFTAKGDSVISVAINRTVIDWKQTANNILNLNCGILIGYGNELGTFTNAKCESYVTADRLIILSTEGISSKIPALQHKINNYYVPDL